MLHLVAACLWMRVNEFPACCAQADRYLCCNETWHRLLFAVPFCFSAAVVCVSGLGSVAHRLQQKGLQTASLTVESHRAVCSHEPVLYHHQESRDLILIFA